MVTISRTRMETFVGLVLLSVVLLLQEVQLPGQSSSSSRRRGKGGARINPSWTAGGTSPKCDELHRLSPLERLDCHVRMDHAICSVPAIELPNDATLSSWPIPYQCDGPAYEALEAKLRTYRQQASSAATSSTADTTEHGTTWGRRAYNIPASKRVLFLGNTHVQQMATALACQQATQVQHLEVIVDDEQDDYTNDDDDTNEKDDDSNTQDDDSNDNDDDENDDDDNSNDDRTTVTISTRTTATRIDFTNNSTLVMVNDPRLLVSDDWMELLLQDTDGWELQDFDAIILGLFNDCTIALKSHGYECESMTDVLFRHIANAYAMRGPILFVSEMSATRSDESTTVRDLIRMYRDTWKRKNMWFINGRRYMADIKLEGAAAHTASNATNTVLDALNKGPQSRSLPRCQGAYGGHADLLAWDITEFLYAQLA